MDILTWAGIVFCISQSAMFSGLNLAFFSVSRLRLEVDKKQGSRSATKVLAMREDANFLLTTILWGNVGINVLLTLLSSQVLAGIGAFLFSTIFITIMGEIVPQAYFSRHALKTAALLGPVLRFYQVLLYPVAKPSAIMLDKWLGKEGLHLYKERQFREMIELHVRHAQSDIDLVEGMGALNFLHLDDLQIEQEGEEVDPDSIIILPYEMERPVFPDFHSNADDPFLRSVQKSGKKWVIFTDQGGESHYALDADSFLREVMFTKTPLNPVHFCHRPIVVHDPGSTLDRALLKMSVTQKRADDDVIDNDLILLWGEKRKVITGADILGRLMRGIVLQRSEQAAGPG